MRRAAISAALLLAATAAAQPVGLVLSPGDARLLRQGSQLPLAAKTGDILFPGDSLTAGQSSVTLLFCPEKSSLTLTPASEILLDARQVRLKSGTLAGRQPAASCALPLVDRSIAVGQQHYGASLTRAVAAGPPPPPEQPPADLPPAADPASRLARAVALEQRNLKALAAAEYRKLAEEWPDAVWLKSRLFVLEEEPVSPAAPPGTGKIYALLIGVSKYQSELVRPLQFAHKDALTFEQYLRSPRGGRLPESDVVLLTDEKATTAAVKNAIETFLKARAGKNDTVVLFIAAHGVAEPGLGAFLITYDSDPQDLAATALPMADIHKLLRDDLTNVGRVMAYVDACRSGVIGAIANRTVSVNASIERLGEAEGELFLFTASRAKEISYEGPQFGGGHGAFTYFLLSAFNGAADRSGDGMVDLNEVIDYVRTKVAEGTYDRQHPRDFGTMETNRRVADIKLEGIRMVQWTGPPPQKELTQLAQAGPDTGRGLALPPPVTDLDRALAGERLAPDDPQGAFAALRLLKTRLTPEQYLLQENRVRVALEERGQQVLLRYLSGDQNPQTRDDFARGAGLFSAARLLTPESLLLESREAFCRGRVKLFEKDYRAAADLLERAARIDSAGAYSYNALGIAYLEQADYPRAMAAFRDAIRLAPYWAYPLHNLALAYAETGAYADAIRSYREAMRLAPRFSYLPYNLGLVYQRTNRRREAEAAYRRAMALAPDLAEPYNALGYLKASQRRNDEAERLYRQALEKDPRLLAARHNLGVLLASQPARVAEAVDLWRRNLEQDPHYLPSRLSLARALERRGDSAGVIEQYREVLRLKPDYVAARLALASWLARSSQSGEALSELREALKLQPSNPLLHEQLGDLYASLHRPADARASYQAALRQRPDSAARKRLTRKLQRL
jgi:tetratricopeptide (TPR) repeat protein